MDTTTPQTTTFARVNTTLGGTKTGAHHRDLLIQVIRSNPGIHVRRLAAIVGISWNTCLHHVHRLEAAGLISSKKVQGKLTVFDKTRGAVVAKAGNALLRDERNLTVARFVAEHPGAHQRAICAGTDLAPSVVTRRLQALEDAGMVERVPEGRITAVHPTEALDEVLGCTETVDPFTLLA